VLFAVGVDAEHDRAVALVDAAGPPPGVDGEHERLDVEAPGTESSSASFCRKFIVFAAAARSLQEPKRFKGFIQSRHEVGLGCPDDSHVPTCLDGSRTLLQHLRQRLARGRGLLRTVM
jgi:hypothetical protein